MINAAANDGEPCSGGQSPSSQDSVPIHGGVPEFSGSVRDRLDFTSAKKTRAAPLFYLGLGLLALEWVRFFNEALNLALLYKTGSQAILKENRTGFKTLLR